MKQSLFISVSIMLLATGLAYADVPETVCITVLWGDQAGWMPTNETSRTAQARHEVYEMIKPDVEPWNHCVVQYSEDCASCSFQMQGGSTNWGIQQDVCDAGTWGQYGWSCHYASCSDWILSGTWSVVCGADTDNDSVPDMWDGCAELSGDDADLDGFGNACDNCLSKQNAPGAGSCVTAVGGVLIGTGVACTDNATCAPDGVCQMAQEDMNANGIGDACECYADCNHDSKVNTTDLGIMKIEFFRTNCATVPCQADINGDNRVNTSDLGIMKVQFFKTGCPIP